MLTKNTHHGAIGESEASNYLSRIAQVTKIGQYDVGLDFSCLLILNGSPQLPFYVQAKSSRVSSRTFNVSKNNVFYWLNFYAPVYITFYDEKDDKLFYLSIEQMRERLESQINPESDSISIKVNPDLILEKNNHNELNKIIIEDYNSKNLNAGSSISNAWGFKYFATSAQKSN